MSAPAVERQVAEPYSRAWFVARLGEQLMQALEHEARNAPPPSPETVERIRLIFAQPAHVPATP